jgi:non-specific serine/threonine protein kinase/serine/threonine-protein kinase
VSELKKCRACGVDVQSNAPFGHCPKCLLELGFGAMPEDAVESSAQSAIPNPQSAIETVRYFGDYELLEQIGRGGMGIVYKARQQSLNRIVALKMISAGEFASPSAVQRFQIEAEAAAKLDHPNIVPIYEIGVHRGQHYFSMKFVEGRSLAEEIRHGKFRFSTDGNFPSKADERERQSAAARLMTTVAHSVHYAHQHGVLHRDLKPSNILLDAGGQPYLTDFGLAKILEHELGITRSAETMGTPSYMSPEQAAGHPLSTATDVYSLGAILYELLTGRPPFVGTNALEVLQQLAGQEPAPPQSLNPVADRDLATICLKCLEKDPVNRYASTEHLADELVRFLANEPIQARPITRREKVWRWCERKPALAGTLASLLLVFALGLAGFLWQWRRGNDALGAAQKSEQAERMQRFQAETNKSVAEREAATSLETVRLLNEMLEGVRPAVAQGRDTTIVREVLEKTETRLNQGRVEQPQVEALIRMKLGQIHMELGDFKKAEAMLQASLALWMRLTGEDHEQVAQVLNAIAVSLHKQFKLTEAERFHLKALATAKRTMSETNLHIAAFLDNFGGTLQLQGNLVEAERLHRDALARREKLLGEENEEVARSLHNLAFVLLAQKKFADAEQLYHKALTTLRKTGGENHPDVAASLYGLAGTFTAQGKLDEAYATHREALSLRQKLFGKEHTEIADSLRGVGLVLYAQGKTAEAEAMFRDALVMQTNILGEWHEKVAVSMKDMALAFHKRGDPARAEPLIVKAIEIRKRLFSAEHSKVAELLDFLGQILAAQGKFPEAEARFNESLQMRVRLFGEENLEVAMSLSDLAALRGQQGRFSEAEQLLAQALAMRMKLLPPDDPAVTHSRVNLAIALRNQGSDQGKILRAEALFDEITSIQQKRYGTESVEVALARKDHADVLDMLRRYEDAEKGYRSALAIYTNKFRGDHAQSAYTLNSLALNLENQSRLPEAELTHRQALAMLESLFGSTNLKVAGSLGNLAGVLKRQHKLSDAETHARQALAVYRVLLGDDDLHVAGYLHDLGLIVQAQGNLIEAESLYREDLRIKQKATGVQRRHLANTFADLGAVLRQQGRLIEGNLCWRQDAYVRQGLGINGDEGGLTNAVAVLTEALRERRDHVCIEARAHIYGRLKQWQKAIDDFSQLLKFQNEGPFALAPLYLEVGDSERYADFRRKVQADFMATTDPATAAEAALVLTLGPTDRGLTTALDLAQVATNVTNHVHFYRFKMIKALVDLRRAQFTTAITESRTSMAGNKTNDAIAIAAGAILAMAQHALRQVEPARQSLAEAAERFETKLAKPDGNDLGPDWPDWLVARILLREAKTKIEMR